MSTGNGPGFVCIGAQKGGTTWLYENLNRHPDVWMPPIKEIHYFNRLCINEKLLGNWTVPHSCSIKRYLITLAKFKINDLRWMQQYFEFSMTGGNYLALFNKKYTGKCISGDITPAYSTLEERGVRFASKVLDRDVPVLFIIRNPVYRSWSVLKMVLRYENRKVEDIATEDLISMLQQPNITLGSEYTKTITLWKQYFNNFHVLTYDELCEAPRDLLTKVSKIIGISDNWNEEVIKKRVWADNKKIPMSPTVLKVLTEQYTDEIHALDKIIDYDCAEHWLKDGH